MDADQEGCGRRRRQRVRVDHQAGDKGVGAEEGEAAQLEGTARLLIQAYGAEVRSW